MEKLSLIARTLLGHTLAVGMVSWGVLQPAWAQQPARIGTTPEEVSRYFAGCSAERFGPTFVIVRGRCLGHEFVQPAGNQFGCRVVLTERVDTVLFCIVDGVRVARLTVDAIGGTQAGGQPGAIPGLSPIRRIDPPVAPSPDTAGDIEKARAAMA